MLSIAVYFSIIGVAFFLVFKRPAVAFVLATTMFSLEQWAQASSPFFAQRQILTNVVAGSLVLLGVIVQLARGRIRSPVYPFVAWLVAALYVYAFASVTWAPEFATSMLHWKQAFPYLVTMVLLAPLTVRDVGDIRMAFTGLLMFGFLLATLLFFTVEWQGRQIVLGHSAFGDIYGGNPLVVGQLGGTLVILGVLYRFRGEPVLFKALKWAAVVLGLALVARSGSRGQLGGAVLVAGLFWTIANPSKSLLKPLIGLILIAVLIVGAKISIDFYWSDSSRFAIDHVEGDYTGRFDNGKVLLDHWLKSPLTALFGLGNSASYSILGIYPHIVTLEVLGEEGLVGFAIYASIIITTIASGFRSFAALKTRPEHRSLFACVVALWTYSFLLINKQGSLLWAHEFFLYTILLAQVALIFEISRTNSHSVTVHQNITGEQPSHVNTRA